MRHYGTGPRMAAFRALGYGWLEALILWEGGTYKPLGYIRYEVAL